MLSAAGNYVGGRARDVSGWYPSGTSNQNYLLVVRSTATPAAATIDYGITCRSGGGHTLLHGIAPGSGRLGP